ncbi:MAG: alpha/beta hydrolase, partial [Acidimicrobiales bacterium]
MPVPLMPGASPFSACDGPNGVLVLHGFTGSPVSMRPLAEAFADAGLSVDLPLLPGHGTCLDDMMATGFRDWAGAVEEAYASLAARSDRVVVAGLSMGGTLALHLGLSHAEISGMVLVNPLVEPPAPSFVASMRQLLDSGTDRIPGIGSDIARPGFPECGYPDTPVAPLLSLFEGVADIAPRLEELSCPMLLLTSRQDHVVPTASGDLLEERAGSAVERVFLENSYHVATLDYDQ